MTALTTPQETALDQTGTVINAYLYLHTPELIFEAPLVDNIQRRKAFIALEVGAPTVGSLSDVGAEMLLQIDIDGVADGGRQRVRGVNIGDSLILVGRSGAGRADGRLTVNQGGTVRVYRDYRPFIKAPYISPDSLEQYKDEEEYTTANAAQPPVACAGTDRLIITSAATASITLDALGDVPSFPVRAGATLASYAWDVGDGTVTDGAVDEAEVTVSFPRGARYISLTVTDSNGISQTTNRLIVVASPADCIPARIDTLTVTPTGNTISVEVNSAYLPDGVPAGARALVAEIENYSGNLIGYSERFSGWVGSESVALRDAKNQITNYTLSLYDVGAFLRANYLFPQSINVAESLGGWYQMVGANIDRLMHYTLQWHTNVLSLASVKLSGMGTTYPFAAWTTSGGAIWDDLNTLANAFAHQITVDSRNVLRIVVDPVIAPTADQAIDYSLPTQRPGGVVTTLTPDRYGRFSLTAREQPQAFWLEAMALLADDVINDVVSAIAPGNAPSFGTSAPSVNNWLVTSQEELNVWAGNLYAARYSPTVSGLTLSTMNPAHFIEPALRQFVAVELPDDIAARYAILDGDERWTIERITYTYSPAGKRAEYQLLKETAAVSPARTTIQTEDGELVQTWSGFDGSIATNTGAITQAFEGIMSLTQAQLNESLARLRLYAVMSDRTVTSDIDFAQGGDGTGTGGDTTTAQQSANGGYNEVAIRLNRFIEQAEAYFTDIYDTGHAAERTAFKAYVSALVTGVDTGALDTWTDYLFDTDDTFPTLTVTQRDDATEEMFCQGAAYAGLTQFSGTLGAMTTPTFAQFSTMLPIFQAGTQLSAWYDLGTNRPLDLYQAYACTLAPADTLSYTAANINDDDIVNGSVVFNWDSRDDGSLIRVQISGRYQDADRIVDGFYIKNIATGVITYDPPVLSIGKVDLSNAVTAAYPVPPGYRADGVYSTTATVPATGTFGACFYRFRNDRTVTDPAVGSFTVTITDLGAR